jgi:hypothetical protein
VPPDPTIKFSAELCDVMVWSRSTFDELYGRLAALDRFAGLLEARQQHQGGA